MLYVHWRSVADGHVRYGNKRGGQLSGKRKYSRLIRSVCGVIGILGIAAIAFNAVQEGSVRVSFMLLASLFAGFIFLYVAIFGTSPLDFEEPDEHGD